MTITKLLSPFRTIKIIVLTAVLFSIPFKQAQAQSLIKGKIIYEKDGKPAAFASVKLINQNTGAVSDASGNFLLNLHHVKQSDTLLISSVGYEDLRLPVQKAAQLSEFKLQESQKMMESVVIRSFHKEEIAGAKSEVVGYYRSWNANNTRGEIGRTFLPGHKEYQVAKVRFKVYNTYDTCIIRLHIREVNNGEPGRELLQDSVVQVINKSPIADKPYEFDLNKYNVILSQKNIFVSFEVLEGAKSDNTVRSLSFVGSEEGNYFYKSGDSDSWHSSNDYTIYMKLLLKYDD